MWLISIFGASSKLNDWDLHWKVSRQVIISDTRIYDAKIYIFQLQNKNGNRNY